MFGRKKIGVALSGGGARGLSHIGVLQVLEDIGVNISAVSGCSMGAIIGAAYCAGVDLKELENFISTTDWKNFLLFSVFTLSRSGIINVRKVDNVLRKFLGDKTFKDCKKQFCCVAVDIIKGEKVVIDDGFLREAVLASISVPGIFPPFFNGVNFLVDGGVIEPLPTEAIKMFGTNFIIASSIVFDSGNVPGDFYAVNRNQSIKDPLGDTGMQGKQTKHGGLEKEIKKLSIRTILDRSLSIMHKQMVKSYITSANIVIEPKVGNFGFFDFARGKEIIKAGRIAAVEKIPEIKKKLRIR